ncbi:MMPL family transporter [Yinghuangia seranimata]|uniref:MMPL family transporter n=1 Tax=Yinghuangia seranimata TaxID=408067 RepID=UPI00248AB38F|nr:MMPL family transporter [Yinghuangia seranimata]MDI2127340.1 MMPL family transporter [Yinghuangia seranimata]
MNSWKTLAALPCGRRSKWVVLIGWLVVIVALSPLAMKLGDAQSNEMSSWLPGSAESTKVVEEQKDFRDNTIANANAVYHRDGGLTDADRQAITADIEAFRAIKGVTAADIKGPVYSTQEQDKGATASVEIPVAVADGGWEDLGKAVKAMKDAAKDDPSGLEHYFAGPAGIAADQSEAFQGIDGALLGITILVVIAILLLTYRSPVLWLVPLISAIFAMMAAWATVYLATKAGVTVNGQSYAVLNIMIFGAGTDYALLLIARYREELRNYEDRHEAMAHALHRAGPAIVASAATVALSMLVLLSAEMNSTQGMGPVCALGIAVGLLVMITLLPALLVIFGRWAFWPRVPHVGTEQAHADGVWVKVGNVIQKRSRTVWVVTAVILGAFAIGVTGLKADGLEFQDQFTNKPQSIKGMETAAKVFPMGAGDPLATIANSPAKDAVVAAIQNTPGVVKDSVRVNADKNGRAEIYATLTDGPDTEAARKTVDRVRDAVHPVPNADARVGGGPAMTLDMERAAQHDDKVVIPLILIAVLIVLCILLRAIIAPIILILTVILSFATALGISSLIFNHVLDYAGMDTTMPLFIFVFLVALGIDYNIFLMHRVREEAQQRGTREGSIVALAATGGVITSAGLVLAATFAVFTTMPLVTFVEMGFAVALGVLLDTFIVRSVLVTALTHDIGPKVWWPSQLAKRPETPQGDVGKAGRDRDEALV